MNPRTMEPNENGIPRYMRDHARFCFWRMETRKEDITKVPYNPNDPKCRAQANRPETFGTFGEAMFYLKSRCGWQPTYLTIGNRDSKIWLAKLANRTGKGEK